ncbi:hypothetical protein MTO96_037196 [Rhipicephalus appendiculatus]
MGTQCAGRVALCGCVRARSNDGTVPHCRWAQRRSSHHEYLRRALLQDKDKQVIMLPGARVRRNGMIVDVSRTSLLPSPTRQIHRAARRLCASQRHDTLAMKGAVVLFVLTAAVAQCSAKLSGGWTDQDPSSDAKYLEFAHFAVGQDTEGLTHYHTVRKLLEVKTQIVSGMNYELIFEIAKSNCVIADGPYNSEKCAPTPDKSIGVCTAVVYERPWNKHKELESINCRMNTGSSAPSAVGRGPHFVTKHWH